MKRIEDIAEAKGWMVYSIDIDNSKDEISWGLIKKDIAVTITTKRRSNKYSFKKVKGIRRDGLTIEQIEERL